MKLNEISKQELRNSIEEMIEQNRHELKERIVLDSELLEELLFYKVELEDGIPNLLKPRNGKENIVKFPVWTGEFLQYIDLSQVSYGSVCWNLSALNSHKVYGHKNRPTKDAYDIIMENTNATIDFSKAYVDKEENMVCGCTFANTYLSNQSLDYDSFSCCNFKNTGINIGVPALKEEFREDLKSGIFDGCFINGIWFSVNEQKKKNILVNYNAMINNYVQDIEKAIQKAKG